MDEQPPLPLIRWLALNGAAPSRRAAAALIASARVRLGGTVCLAPAAPVSDEVTVDGVLVQPLPSHLHVLLHKPAGCLTSRRPGGREEGQPTVYHFLDEAALTRHCCAVGRLDEDTSGALLFSSDGALAAALLNPRSAVPKLYRATLRRQSREPPPPLSPAAVAQLAAGVQLPASKGKPARSVRGAATNAGGAVLLQVTGGAYHQVKIMLALVGRPVLALHRVSFAGLGVEGLAPGQSRPLREEEVRALYRLAAVGGGVEAEGEAG